MSKHTHRSVIAQERPSPEPISDVRARVNVRIIEWCACGSMRLTTRKGKHLERGEWTFPTEWPEANKPLA